MPIFKKPVDIYKNPKMQGDSLLEVVLALWLLSIAAWATMHFYLKIIHSTHALQWRAQALQLLEATAQGVESGEAISSMQLRANKRALAQLPNGKASITAMTVSTLDAPSLTEGPFLVEIRWNISATKLASLQTRASKSTSTHSWTEYPQRVWVAVMRNVEK